MRIDRLTVSGVGKRYGFHRALADVDLTVHSGKLCALLGANGAGKSTLLGILSTLVRPSTGGFAYHRGGGLSLTGGEELRRHIGVLTHSSLVYGDLTGVENLVFYGKLYGSGDPEGLAERRLDRAGIDKRARDKPVRTYSRGMVQRLAIARALLHDPQVLLLDEPFTGLDREGVETLTHTLAQARADGCLVIVVTHDLEAIAGLTDHAVVLRGGRIVHERRALLQEESGDESGAAPRGDPPAGFSYDALKDIYHQTG